MAQEIVPSETAASPFTQIVDAVKEAFLDLGKQLANFIPNVIIALIILCVGILLAKIIRTVLTKFLQGIKIDSLTEKAGMQSALAKMGVTGSLATLIPKIISAFIIIFMVKQAAVSAGFTDITNFIDTLFAFTPKLITAFLIMVIGIFVGDIIQNTTFNALDAKGLDYANSLSKIVFALIFVVFLTVSLSQVGIETELLKSTVKILLVGVSLALALALGLGLKDHANNIVAAVYVRDIFRRGTEVEVDGKVLKIMGVGPVTTKLQREDGEFVVMPNSTLVTTTIKGRTDA